MGAQRTGEQFRGRHLTLQRAEAPLAVVCILLSVSERTTTGASYRREGGTYRHPGGALKLR